MEGLLDVLHRRRLQASLQSNLMCHCADSVTVNLKDRSTLGRLNHDSVIQVHWHKGPDHRRREPEEGAGVSADTPARRKTESPKPMISTAVQTSKKGVCKNQLFFAMSKKGNTIRLISVK